MKGRVFGWTGVELPVVGIGTWQMEAADRAAAIAAVRRALDLGLTHVDTAELYGDGLVEETIVAPAIAGRRDEVFLVSKVMPSNATRAGTIAACERSLKRLRTDRLDLYLLHWPGEHPLEGTIDAFERLVADGKIVRWGVSNFDVEDLEAAERLAGRDRIACNQVAHHLRERGIEHRVLPWCRKRKIPVVAYSPFGSTGGFPKPSSAGGKLLAELASSHGVSPRAIALAFLTRDPLEFAIPRSTNAAHVDDLAASARVTLSKKDAAALDAAFPLGPVPRTLPTI